MRLHIIDVVLYSKLQHPEERLQRLAQDSTSLMERILFMEPQPGTSPGTLEYWTGHVDPFVVVGGGAGVVFVSAWQPTEYTKQLKIFMKN